MLAAGLAMENMGDIDYQALAGAVGTGTHGTGETLGSISTQVVGLRLVLATGETLDCSATQEPAIFDAARVSVGALGVTTRITLRVLPAYRLHERTWVADFDGVHRADARPDPRQPPFRVLLAPARRSLRDEDAQPDHRGAPDRTRRHPP